MKNFIYKVITASGITLITIYIIRLLKQLGVSALDLNETVLQAINKSNPLIIIFASLTFVQEMRHWLSHYITDPIEGCAYDLQHCPITSFVVILKIIKSAWTISIIVIGFLLYIAAHLFLAQGNLVILIVEMTQWTISVIITVMLMNFIQDSRDWQPETLKWFPILFLFATLLVAACLAYLTYGIVYFVSVLINHFIPHSYPALSIWLGTVFFIIATIFHETVNEMVRIALERARELASRWR